MTVSVDKGELDYESVGQTCLGRRQRRQFVKVEDRVGQKERSQKGIMVMEKQIKIK
jgi:hypothetical protein